MFRTEPGKDRWQLGFPKAVQANFGYLLSYGMKPVEQDVTFVRYESPTVFVNVYHGRGSFEIGVEIGRLDRPEKYDLDYVVSWAGKEAWDSEGFGRGTMFQVSTLEGVQSIVPKVAQLVKKYGGPFLLGDSSFYDELQRANEQASLAFQRNQMLSQLRKEADLAWRSKDFVRFVELLEPVRADLTEIEEKRLLYAEKHGRLAPDVTDG